MKRKLLIGGVTFFAVFMVWRMANGSGKDHNPKKYDDIAVNARSVEVSGDIASSFSVPNGRYGITKTKNDLVFILNVDVREPMGISQHFDELAAEFLDERGMPIPGVDQFKVAHGLWATSDQVDKIEACLHSGSGRTSIAMICAGVIGEENMNETMDLLKSKAQSFRLIAKAKDETPEPMHSNAGNDHSTGDDLATENSATVLGSRDWDQLLDDYDEFLTQYIAFIKKAGNHDLTAMGDAAGLMAKAEDIDRQLKQGEKDDALSAAQLKKLIKLEAKMIDASADLIQNQ